MEKKDFVSTGEGILSGIEKFEVEYSYKDFNLTEIIEYVLNGYRDKKS